VHCAAGKDRTGWAVSLMLLALGVPNDAVIEQYLLSNRRRPERHPRLVELEEAGILERATVDGRPPRTEYRLTPRGRELRGLVNALRRLAQ